MNLSAQIEAVLFFKSEPVAVKKLAAMLKTGEDDVLSALTELETTLAHRGIALVRNGDEVELRTAPAVSSLIESLTKEELSRDLGKAGLETIAIILYKGAAKRNDIDYIRGVNSSFILRNLLIRGLIERESDSGRGFLYKPTTDLLAHMGVAKLEQLPEFDKVKEALASFEEASVE
jgi:segregation and condensation protein B